MKKLLTLSLSIAIVITASACNSDRVNTALAGNNKCPVAGCTSKPAPCNYNVVTGKCQ